MRRCEARAVQEKRIRDSEGANTARRQPHVAACCCETGTFRNMLCFISTSSMLGDGFSGLPWSRFVTSIRIGEQAGGQSHVDGHQSNLRERRGWHALRHARQQARPGHKCRFRQSYQCRSNGHVEPGRSTCIRPAVRYAQHRRSGPYCIPIRLGGFRQRGDEQHGRGEHARSTQRAPAGCCCGICPG